MPQSTRAAKHVFYHPAADTPCCGQLDICRSVCDLLHGVKWKHKTLSNLSDSSFCVNEDKCGGADTVNQSPVSCAPILLNL